MLIKKDKNAELEKILEQKKINEQAKNLLQGILYKVEVSYKDYQKVKKGPGLFLRNFRSGPFLRNLGPGLFLRKKRSGPFLRNLGSGPFLRF